MVGKQRDGRGFDGEGDWEQHLPVVAGCDEVVECAPGIGGEESGDVGQRLLFDDRLGDDDELVVFAGDVEVLDVVAVGGRDR